MPNAGISFVIHDLNSWGGQDRVTLEISKRLSRQVPVSLYSFTFSDDDSSEWGDTVHHLVRPRFNRPVLLKSIIFHIVTFFQLMKSKKKSPALLIHAAGACSLVSDIIQVHFVHRAWDSVEEKMGGTPRSFLARIYHWVLRRYDLAMERLIFSPSKRYIAVSQHVANELKKNYPSITAVQVVHPGVDVQYFCPGTQLNLRQTLGIKEGEVVAFFAGSYERKGLSSLIEAWGLLLKQGNIPPRLVAIGGGNRDYYLKLAAMHGVSAYVLLCPPTKNILNFYQMSDFFILPTRYEPFGMVALEAMACGKAPITSRLAGASELIQDGVNGIILDDPQDAAEIARAVLRFAQSPEHRQALGAEARKSALNQSWDLVAKRYENALWGTSL